MHDFISLDNRISNTIRSVESTRFLRPLAIFLAHSADPWFCIIMLAFLWLAGNRYWKERALVMIAGTVLIAAIVFVVKYTVRRRRPDGNWGTIYRLTNPHSFPSGHAARCFMLSVLGWCLGPTWLGWILFIWAILVSLARVGMGVHYISDTLAGGLLGIITALVTFYLFLNYQQYLWNTFPYLPLADLAYLCG